MSVRKLRLPIVCLFLVVLARPGLFAREKLDLDRIMPVPPGEPVPIQDFFRPRILQEPKLNPSGTYIAALITAGTDKYQLLTYELKTAKAEFLNSPGDTDIYDFHWLNDERLIYALSSQKIVGLGLFAVNVRHLNANYPLLQYYGSSLVAIPKANRLQPLVWTRYDSFESGAEGGVVAVDTNIQSGKFINLLKANRSSTDTQEAKESNERHILRRYPLPPGEHGMGYIADKEGQLEFAFTATNGLFTLHHFAGETWTKCPVDLELIDVLSAGNRPGELAVIGPRNTGQPRPLQFMEGATGRLGEVLVGDKEYDFNGYLYRDPASRAIVGAVYQRAGPQVVWFDPGYARTQAILDRFFPGVVARIIGNDEKGSLLLVSTYSDRQPAVYQWVDIAASKAGLIKNSAPWIDPARMQPMNAVKFKTRDGHNLDAYLTLPAGATRQNPPPLVVLPHGGPWVRDTWGFDGQVQFLASRGYAVLQPNYRGSTGYGWMFPEEDEWAFVKMHDDVTDATKAVIAAGLVDAKRVAIMGGSFGGYLALSGATREPDLYRCAVTIAGVFDWELLINDSKFNRYESPQYSRLILKLGDPAKQPAKFADMSPLRHVDRIHIPVFVIHGKDDPVVEVTQSKRLVSELQKYKIPHEALFVGGEGHGMSYFKNRVETYTQIEAFLAKNLR